MCICPSGSRVSTCAAVQRTGCYGYPIDKCFVQSEFSGELWCHENQACKTNIWIVARFNRANLKTWSSQTVSQHFKQLFKFQWFFHSFAFEKLYISKFNSFQQVETDRSITTLYLHPGPQMLHELLWYRLLLVFSCSPDMRCHDSRQD